jgi:hypothetical protein
MRIRPSLADANYGLARRMAGHRLLRRMMARQRIETQALRSAQVETALYRALHTCTHCPAKAACTAWLGGAEPPHSYVRFCPNAETIEALRIMSA